MSNRSSEDRSMHWQCKRLAVLKRDNCTCRSCGKEEPLTAIHALQVYPVCYIPGKKLHQYPDDSLITWCKDCYKGRIYLIEYIQKALSRMSIGAYSGVLALTHATACDKFLSYAGKLDVMLDDDLLTRALKVINRAYKAGKEDAS